MQRGGAGAAAATASSGRSRKPPLAQRSNFHKGAPAAHRENWLSARGTRSAFCKGAPAARRKNRAPQPGGFRSKIKNNITRREASRPPAAQTQREQPPAPGPHRGRGRESILRVGAKTFPKPIDKFALPCYTTQVTSCRVSSSGRATASQAVGGGFESRILLQDLLINPCGCFRVPMRDFFCRQRRRAFSPQLCCRPPFIGVPPVAARHPPFGESRLSTSPLPGSRAGAAKPKTLQLLCSLQPGGAATGKRAPVWGRARRAGGTAKRAVGGFRSYKKYNLLRCDTLRLQATYK